jgi:hypothetical protein
MEEITEKIYNYKNNLSKFYCNDVNNYDNVFLVPYSVNLDGKYPFLLFLLSTLNQTKELSFHKVANNENMNPIEFTHFAKMCLFDLFYVGQYTKMFDEFNELLIFDGFFEYDNNLYLIYNITNAKLEIYEDFINPLCLVLVDEIVNKKHVCDVNIHSDVVDLFTYNEHFCFLRDEKNECYEIPSVYYLDKPKKLVKFIYTFGESAQDNYNSIFGPYYYFTNYENALGHCKSQKESYGLVRFAIFSGNMKYIENHPDDEIDKSEIKQLRLKDDSLNKLYETLTLRITDYEGKWSNYYDSVYLGRTLLDDDSYLKEKNLLVVKNYDQQTSLSYHFLSTK